MAQLGARLDGIEEVVGSNPIGSTKILRVQPGDMGNTFGPKGFSSGSSSCKRSSAQITGYHSKL